MIGLSQSRAAHNPWYFYLEGNWRNFSLFAASAGKMHRSCVTLWQV
jgi:hypothetical protein